MKSPEFELGLAFLLIGVVICIRAYPIFQEYSTSLGILARAFSSQAEADYELAEAGLGVGVILALVGFLLALYGATANPQNAPAGRPQTVPVPVPP